jgi:hypothetical protein
MDGFEISRQTLKRAYILATSAKKLSMSAGVALFDRQKNGDAMWFMFTTKTDVVIVLCCPSCYLVTYGPKDASYDDAEYLIVNNIRTFLQKLKKLGYEGITDGGIEELHKMALEDMKDPTDKDIKEIEEEKDEDDDE